MLSTNRLETRDRRLRRSDTFSDLRLRKTGSSTSLQELVEKGEFFFNRSYSALHHFSLRTLTVTGAGHGRRHEAPPPFLGVRFTPWLGPALPNRRITSTVEDGQYNNATYVSAVINAERETTRGDAARLVVDHRISSRLLNRKRETPLNFGDERNTQTGTLSLVSSCCFDKF